MLTLTERVVVLMAPEMARELAERAEVADTSRAALVRGAVALESEVRQIALDCLQHSRDALLSADARSAYRHAYDALDEAVTRTMGEAAAQVDGDR